MSNRRFCFWNRLNYVSHTKLKLWRDIEKHNENVVKLRWITLITEKRCDSATNHDAWLKEFEQDELSENVLCFAKLSICCRWWKELERKSESCENCQKNYIKKWKWNRVNVMKQSWRIDWRCYKNRLKWSLKFECMIQHSTSTLHKS